MRAVDVCIEDIEYRNEWRFRARVAETPNSWEKGEREVKCIC
jgi:hypothetical protein